MSESIELCGNPADEVYATSDDFGAVHYRVAEPPVEELPFDIPRD
ncbi:MAG: hypothetical protein WC538_04580 [Thermoanaerobaculia bacterium]|jgi:hypothetical protein